MITEREHLVMKSEEKEKKTKTGIKYGLKKLHWNYFALGVVLIALLAEHAMALDRFSILNLISNAFNAKEIIGSEKTRAVPEVDVSGMSSSAIRDFVENTNPPYVLVGLENVSGCKKFFQRWGYDSYCRKCANTPNNAYSNIHKVRKELEKLPWVLEKIADWVIYFRLGGGIDDIKEKYPKIVTEGCKHAKSNSRYSLTGLDMLAMKLMGDMKMMSILNWSVASNSCEKFQEDVRESFLKGSGPAFVNLSGANEMPFTTHQHSKTEEKHFFAIVLKGEKEWRFHTETDLGCPSEALGNYRGFAHNYFFPLFSTCGSEKMKVWRHLLKPKQVIVLPKIGEHAHGVYTHQESIGFAFTGDESEHPGKCF